MHRHQTCIKNMVDAKKCMVHVNKDMWTWNKQKSSKTTCSHQVKPWQTCFLSVLIPASCLKNVDLQHRRRLEGSSENKSPTVLLQKVFQAFLVANAKRRSPKRILERSVPSAFTKPVNEVFGCPKPLLSFTASFWTRIVDKHHGPWIVNFPSQKSLERIDWEERWRIMTKSSKKPNSSRKHWIPKMVRDTGGESLW